MNHLDKYMADFRRIFMIAVTSNIPLFIKKAKKMLQN
jgi:hypothetical protein